MIQRGCFPMALSASRQAYAARAPNSEKERRLKGMKSMNRWGRVVLVAASFLLLAGGTAFAQLQTGNLYGKVVDQKGSPLPGVTLTLVTGVAPQVQVSNAQGEFRFLSLA